MLLVLRPWKSSLTPHHTFIYREIDKAAILLANSPPPRCALISDKEKQLVDYASNTNSQPFEPTPIEQCHRMQQLSDIYYTPLILEVITGMVIDANGTLQTFAKLTHDLAIAISVIRYYYSSLD